MRHLAVIACLLLLCACESPLQQLKAINPSADDFPSALAAEYLAYADSESELGRKLSGEYYADKGLKALKGEAVEPEKPDSNIDPKTQHKLAEARSKLMKLMTPGMKQAAPQKLARAQLLFDCWQHQLSRELNQEYAPCAEEFHATMAELHKAEHSMPKDAKP